MTLLPTYGRWTVIGAPFCRRTGSGNYYSVVPCRCECGARSEVVRARLLKGPNHGCVSCSAKRRKPRSTPPVPPKPRTKQAPLPPRDTSRGRPYDLVSMDGPGAIPRRILET